MGILDGPNKVILKADTKVQEVLEALAQHVDHWNKNKTVITLSRPVSGFTPDLRKPEEKPCFTVKVDGVEFGYRLEDHKVFMRRIVFMKVPGYRIEDLSENERERIMTALFNVFFLPGGRPPEVKKINLDCLLFIHDFVPEIAVERSPGLVSIAGGWEKPN